MRTAYLALSVFFLTLSCSAQQTAPTPPSAPIFNIQEVMIPVRDGVHLQTVILSPVGATKPLPILFRRTPYGVPEKAPEQMPASLKELAQDGYIFVIQNLRGRFKSEGIFLLSSWVDLKDPKATNETTDAYDSIEWLIKNIPNNNGKVGMYGVSYDGLTTALTLLHPHPALKAISEQASPVDQWMNDDDHRYGALRESYDFEYAVLEQADKNKNTNFAFEIYDTYEWYLNLGPLSNINAKYLHGSIPYWNDSVAHPDYDEFWKKEAWVSQLHASTVPNLNVAGFWDQEDPSASFRLPDTKPRVNFAKPSKLRFSAITCTAWETNPHGKPAFFKVALTPGAPTPSGRLNKPSPPIFIFTPTARFHSIHLPTLPPTTHPPQNNSANTFPIPPIPFPIASGPFLPPIPPAIGAPGKLPTSASSIIARMY